MANTKRLLGDEGHPDEEWGVGWDKATAGHSLLGTLATLAIILACDETRRRLPRP